MREKIITVKYYSKVYIIWRSPESINVLKLYMICINQYVNNLLSKRGLELYKKMFRNFVEFFIVKSFYSY